MKLTQDEIIERWKAFNIHYDRIQVIKSLADEMDRDGDFDDPDYMQMQMTDFMKEINYLYNQCMLPILSEIVAHINEYTDLIDEIVLEEKYGDLVTLVQNAENLLQEKENESKAADISKIVKELMSEDSQEIATVETNQSVPTTEDDKISIELLKESYAITEQVKRQKKEQDEETSKQIADEIRSLTQRFKKRKLKEKQTQVEIKQEKINKIPTDFELDLNELG
jgi:hypothetical protein